MKLGKANYSGGGSKEIFKIKDGSNVFRILPPMGDLADKGIWRKYYRVVWGYKDSNDNNRPFEDCRVRNFKTGMVDVESEAHLRSEAEKAELKRLTDELKAITKAGGTITDEQKKAVKKQKDVVMKYNIEAKHHMNAMSLDGKIGLLKLGKRGMDGLKAEIERLMDEGVDPLSVENGRFFDIKRTGSGLDTVYTVTEYKENKETEEYGVVQVTKKSVLTEAVINRLADEAFELDKLYPAPTPEEVTRIVKEGAPAVDDVLGAKEKREDKKEEPKQEAKSEAPKEEKKEEVGKQQAQEEKKESVSETETNTQTDSSSAQTASPSEEVKTSEGETVNTATGEVLSEGATQVETPAASKAQSDEEWLKEIGAV